MTFGPWKIWNGGECPTDNPVQVQLRTDSREKAEQRPIASGPEWEWRVDGWLGDIVAYREVEASACWEDTEWVQKAYRSKGATS